MDISKKAEKRAQQEQKELFRLQKEKARPKRPTYLFYLILVLCLIYIVDEVGTSLHNGMVNEINLEFFVNGMGLTKNEGNHYLSLMETLSNALLVIGFFYKTLADRYGRKPFLIINTLGMALGLLLCLWSAGLWMYVLGFFVIRFFVTPDEQIVYIYESAPEKMRGRIHSIIKGVADLGLLLIPLGRKTLMADNPSLWRYVFLIPAIIGFLGSFLALFFARETDLFLDERIAYLSLSEEQRKAIAQEKKDASKKQGGFFSAVKYAFQLPQLKWLFICTLLFTLSRTITSQYSTILDRANYTTGEVSNALLIFPLTAAAIVFVTGFFSDQMGRKPTSIVLLSISLLSLLFLVLGAAWRWNEWLLGAIIGLFLGSYWSNSDTLILMVGESSPTNLRASLLSAQTLFYGVGMVVSMLANTIAFRFLAENAIGVFCLVLAVPCFALSIVFLFLKVHETNHVLLKDNETLKE